MPLEPNMNYFPSIIDKDALKREYRKLTLENHPDRGGSTSVMRDIISSYKLALSTIDEISPFTSTEEVYEENEDWEFDIEELLSYEDNFDFVDMDW